MSYEKIVTVSPRGQLVIPKKARDILNLGKSHHLKMTVDEEHQVVNLQPIMSFTDQLEGTAKDLLNKEEDAISFTNSLREDR